MTTKSLRNKGSIDHSFEPVEITVERNRLTVDGLGCYDEIGHGIRSDVVDAMTRLALAHSRDHLFSPFRVFSGREVIQYVADNTRFMSGWPKYVADRGSGTRFPLTMMPPIAADGDGNMFWLPAQARMIADDINLRTSVGDVPY